MAGLSSQALLGRLTDGYYQFTKYPALSSMAVHVDHGKHGKAIVVSLRFRLVGHIKNLSSGLPTNGHPMFTGPFLGCFLLPCYKLNF